jgi:hypothetical protein
MFIEDIAKKELLNKLLAVMVTPNAKEITHSQEDESKYFSFINEVTLGKKAEVKLPSDYLLKFDLVNLIKSSKVYVESTAKFIATLTTNKPENVIPQNFAEKYIGNELKYVFLDNHPGIINVNSLKDIPVDYEGLMAVPFTVLEYKNVVHFNIHRVLYAPKINGKIIYPRIVISNKVVA